LRIQIFEIVFPELLQNAAAHRFEFDEKILAGNFTKEPGRIGNCVGI
jgi:hypothetical protein